MLEKEWTWNWALGLLGSRTHVLSTVLVSCKVGMLVLVTELYETSGTSRSWQRLKVNIGFHFLPLIGLFLPHFIHSLKQSFSCPCYEPVALSAG